MSVTVKFITHISLLIPERTFCTEKEKASFVHSVELI